jgi:hypothetical protein
MILSYSFIQFEQLILDKDKIHTFRRDTARRWKPGRHIDHYMGSPRNPRSNPRKFAEGECKAVQEVKMYRGEYAIVIEIDARKIKLWSEIEILAHNDGLTVDEFIKFFIPKPWDKWEGRLIHWTEKLY